MLRTQLFIYFYSLTILFFILGYLIITAPKRTTHLWLFVNIVIWTIVVLLLESIGLIINGATSNIFYHLGYFINTLLYAFNFFPTIAYFIYFDNRIISDPKKRRNRILMYLIPVMIVWFSLFNNYKTGFLFRITINNIYTRGFGMYLIVGFALFILVFYIISMKKYLKSVEGRLIAVMISFTTLPVFGLLLQAVFFGVPALWSMFTLLNLFAFVFIEREDLMRDTLTNLSTRGQFDLRLKRLLKKNKPFVILMIDMDDFKSINDTFGHDEGDQALVIASNILSRSVKHIDMVSRYGGDEFMLLIESDKKEAPALISERIQTSLQLFNEKHTKPYTISMSIGSYYVDHPKNETFNDILGKVDELMYAHKRTQKTITEKQLNN